MAVYPFLVLVLGVALIAVALAQGGLIEQLKIGREGLDIHFDNSAVGQQVTQEQARSAQPELEDRVRDLEERAQAGAAPAAASDALVAGTWQADNGFTYVLQQYGSSVVLQEQSLAYGITATGTGTVSGDTVSIQFRALNNTTGTATLRVSGTEQTGMTLAGTFTNDWLQTTTLVTMTRTGP